MNTVAKNLISESEGWLKDFVLPLWISQGVDRNNGSFIESLDEVGIPTQELRRALVQARQIYAMTEAAKMKLISVDQIGPIVKAAVHFLMAQYALPSGAFIHSVDPEGRPVQLQSELYTQAFVLFGLARAFELLGDQNIKKAAKKLIQYLNSERKANSGGYTEIKSGHIVYQSNPHMHLFEAAIEWLRVEKGPEWTKLAQELFEHAKKSFIDSQTGLLAENFNSEWKPNLEQGHFIFEPGHQYEWAWLFLKYEELSGQTAEIYPLQLYNLAEKNGIQCQSHLAFDEVSSEFKIKKNSARFWPQCERIKTAVALGICSPKNQQAQFAKTADQAMSALTKYFNTSKKGLWYDTCLPDGSYIGKPTKASSLYHIINAISEYSQKRPLLFEQS